MPRQKSRGGSKLSNDTSSLASTTSAGAATITASLPHIIALDPGGTTGFAWLNHKGLGQSHLTGENHHADLWGLLLSAAKVAEQHNTKLHIVCEQFEFRQTERHRDFINYIPREYIGVARLFCQMNGGPELFMQSASQAKSFFSDDKVKKLGLWIPSLRHAMDATRHYLYHRVFTLGDKSLLLLLR